jgi:NAD(P)-dependent dehydrogenase (short-subunit alcohol dehydrogenase family)
MHQDISKLFDLTGKVAIVTGGAKGIGYGITLRLAQAGAKVVICGRNEGRVQEVADGFREQGYEVTGIGCDVGDEASVQNLVAQTVQGYGRIDILVNNAGNYPKLKLQETTQEVWDSVFASNVRGMFLCTKAAAKVMEEQGSGGSIINCSSIGAFRCNHVGMSAYHSSKAAMLGFTNHEAAELGPKGIRVNAIAVGPINAAGPNKDGIFTPETVTFSNPVPPKIVPIRRMGSPADIGNACLYLASEAGSFVNGIYLTVDGGMSKVPTFGYPEYEQG